VKRRAFITLLGGAAIASTEARYRTHCADRGRDVAIVKAGELQ